MRPAYILISAIAVMSVIAAAVYVSMPSEEPSTIYYTRESTAGNGVTDYFFHFSTPLHGKGYIDYRIGQKDVVYGGEYLYVTVPAMEEHSHGKTSDCALCIAIPHLEGKTFMRTLP